MFNFYLSRIGYESASSNEIEENFILLNEIAVETHVSEDTFLKNKNIWELNTRDGIMGDVVFSKFRDKQLATIVIPKLLESCGSIDEEFISLEEFDTSKYRIYNAFFGAKFETEDARHISDKEKYETFKGDNLWDLTADSFWDRREQLFSKIILCPSIKGDLKKIGGTYLDQIKNKLVELDNYLVKHWKKDENFSYADANEKSSLNISPESKKTMDQEKYYNLRIFKLPDGRNKCFDLHIKTGNLRFHFFPEDSKIYIGYIGKHLDTDKFN